MAPQKRRLIFALLTGERSAECAECFQAKGTSDPSITPVPTASVSEIASIAPPINAEWGVIE